MLVSLTQTNNAIDSVLCSCTVYFKLFFTLADADHPWSVERKKPHVIRWCLVTCSGWNEMKVPRCTRSVPAVNTGSLNSNFIWAVSGLLLCFVLNGACVDSDAVSQCLCLCALSSVPFFFLGLTHWLVSENRAPSLLHKPTAWWVIHGRGSCN